MSRSSNRKITHASRIQDGIQVTYDKDALLSEEQMGEHVKLFASLTIQPGDRMAPHKHEGDSEAYYIVSGTGSYTDNGETYQVAPGDVLWCQDGGSHGMVNDGTDPLVIIALIIKSA